MTSVPLPPLSSANHVQPRAHETNLRKRAVILKCSAFHTFWKWLWRKRHRLPSRPPALPPSVSSSHPLTFSLSPSLPPSLPLPFLPLFLRQVNARLSLPSDPPLLSRALSPALGWAPSASGVDTGHLFFSVAVRQKAHQHLQLHYHILFRTQHHQKAGRSPAAPRVHSALSRRRSRKCHRFGGTHFSRLPSRRNGGKYCQTGKLPYPDSLIIQATLPLYTAHHSVCKTDRRTQAIAGNDVRCGVSLKAVLTGR